MDRKIKKIVPQVFNLQLENQGGRVLITGEIKEEIQFVETNKKIISQEDYFSFNHSFAAAQLKGGFPVKGEVLIEHITSTIADRGGRLKKNYLLTAILKGEGLIRALEEKFFVHHTTELPPPPVSEVRVSQRKIKLQPEEPKDSLEKESQKSIRKLVQQLIEEKLEELQREKNPEKPKPTIPEEVRKENFIRKSKKQQLFGYTTRKIKGG